MRALSRFATHWFPRSAIALVMMTAVGWALLPHVSTAQGTTFPIVDSGQTACYDSNGMEIACSAAGTLSGQDAQHNGNQPSYTNNGNSTITDNITGLMWQQSPDLNGDGSIDTSDKLTYEVAVSYCENLTLAGHTDWWLPDIKQLYSLIDFSGTDPSGINGADTSNLVPFIDTNYFAFGYGDTAAGERIIDAQFASSTLYVSTAYGQSLFGVNLADGRIKGYGLSGPGGNAQEKTFYVLCARGNASYGQNNFIDNGDGTITDHATGMMWAQNDSGTGLNWEAALAWVQQQNDATYLGYSDWRLPNAKELQSIVDYTRSPDTSGSAAIDPVFSATSIINELGTTDYPAYWSSTTHANMSQAPGRSAAYITFGRGMGYMNGSWIDVHGAGAQRSDPKTGDPSEFETGRGSQGDAIRIYNYVRLVRDADSTGTAPTPTDSAISTPTTAAPPASTPTTTPPADTPPDVPPDSSSDSRRNMYLPNVERTGENAPALQHDCQPDADGSLCPPPPPGSRGN